MDCIILNHWICPWETCFKDLRKSQTIPPPSGHSRPIKIPLKINASFQQKIHRILLIQRLQNLIDKRIKKRFLCLGKKILWHKNCWQIFAEKFHQHKILIEPSDRGEYIEKFSWSISFFVHWISWISWISKDFMDFIGVHWCSLVFIGVHWYSLVFIGIHWYSLDFFIRLILYLYKFYISD